MFLHFGFKSFGIYNGKQMDKKSECTDIVNRMCEWFYAQLSKNADILQLISLLLRINVKMI